MNDHDKCTQRKQCGERWDIKRKVRYRPNVHTSTTTPMRVTTGVKTERREKILHKWSRGWKMTIPKSMSMVRGCDAPKSNTTIYTRTNMGDRIPSMLKIKGPELKRG